MHKDLRRPIVYALCFFFGLLLMPLIIISYQQIYGHRVDPMEKAVGEALGNEDLKLGAKLQVWIDYLGMPDMVVEYDNKIIQNTELYWLKKGIGVGIDSYEEPPVSAAALNKEVDLLVIPFRKNLPSDFMQYRRIAWPINDPSSALAFEKLLDAKINNVSTGDMQLKDIAANYSYFDASDNYYYDLPFPFSSKTAKFYHEKNNCYVWTCTSDVNLALVHYGKLSVGSYPIMLIALPYIMFRFSFDIFYEKS